MEQIVIVPNCLSEEICNRLIVEANFDGTENSKGAFNYNDYNGIERRNLSDHPIVNSIAKQFGFTVENAPILWYPRHTGNSLHADNAIVDNGIVVKVKEWKRSVIIFLNDDFDGGELCYPEQGVFIKPKTGTMVVAPAGIEYPHMVNTVNKDRYVLVMRLI